MLLHSIQLFSEQVVVPPDSKSVSPNPREMIHQDEDEDLSDTRLSNMLIANNDFRSVI